MAASKPNPPRDPLLVAVLRLLPEPVRERFCYVTLVIGLIAVVVGLWRAPSFTVASSSGFSILYWLARMLGR